MGAFIADPILPVSCSSASAHTGITSYSPCHFNFSNQAGQIETDRGANQCKITLIQRFNSAVSLLKRVLDIDIEHCPLCDGALKIIAAILEKAAIIKILDHLGLPAWVLPRAPAQIFDPFETT